MRPGADPGGGAAEGAREARGSGAAAAVPADSRPSGAAALIRGAAVVLAVAAVAAGCGEGPTGSSVPKVELEPPPPGENPIIRARHSADPAALVHDGRVWLYTGHDEATPLDNFYVMDDWQLYSSADMLNWEHHGSPVSLATFEWAAADAWAAHAIERDGKFYFYAPVSHATIFGFSIGVAVADSPQGPFVDARGSALITNDMTDGPNGMHWDDIDPAVFIDDDGQAYLFWGNTVLHYAKLKDNMIELDGPIMEIDLPLFVEGPWVHQREGTYYLSYAYGWPEQIAYATAPSITGPWTFQHVINDVIPNCGTNHQSIIEFEGDWYFFYHNAALPGGGDFRRSVAVERMFYDSAGAIFPITQALYGLAVDPPPGADTTTS
ncbi:MAG: glycoside hydrolase family 43 protein [Longimicrobiales bacterium]|nr:glycoside hydrolase family 43 protein [Longimicrobiales bacterium]